jgi:hypothetical protein
VPVEVELRNEGSEEIWMVGVVDGSEEGLRYPRWTPAVTCEGRLVASPRPAEDPLVGPLRPQDFRRLAPQESFDPTRPEQGCAYLPLSTFAGFSPAEPGVYRFTLELSTASPSPDEWLGRFGQDGTRAEVLALVARVPHLTVTSNPFEVLVES